MFAGLPGIGDAKLGVELAVSGERSEVRKLELASKALRAGVKASLQGHGLQAWFETPAKALAAPLLVELDLAVDDLSRLGSATITAADLRGGVRLHGEIRGSVEEPAPELTLSSAKLQAHGVAASLQGRLQREGERFVLSDFVADLGAGSRAEASASVSVAVLNDARGTLMRSGRVELMTQDFALAAFAAALPGLPKWLEPGRLSGKVSYGARETPGLSAALSLRVPGLLEASDKDLVVSVEANAEAKALRLSKIEAQLAQGRVHGSAVLAAGLDHFLAGSNELLAAKLEAKLALDRVDLSSLPRVELFRDLVGNASGALSVTGTLAEPAPRLDLQLSDVGLRLRDGPRVEGLAAELRVRPDRVTVERFDAEMGAGAAFATRRVRRTGRPARLAPGKPRSSLEWQGPPVLPQAWTQAAR